MPVRASQPAVVPSATSQAAPRFWLWLLPAAVAVLVYLPSLRGQFIWNDADYVTKPALRSLAGLGRIWSELGATEQYYPLLHSFFWVQQKVFGDAPLGYHVVNVLLHAACAALLVLVVRRLFADVAPSPPPQVPMSRDRLQAIPLLSGLIFAVHPVYVESVAWISEQKNTFSLFWYLLAGLVYLRGQEEDRETRGRGDLGMDRKWYWLATFCFVLALLSKSLTATLPAVLLVLAWWRRGRIDLRREVVPLLPWLVAGAGMGLVTGWVEKHFVGAQGDDFALGLIERGVLAGRVIWFYLGKYAWPAELIFIYPRWTVDTGVWWQWLFPAAAVALLVVLWSMRHRTRGPLAGYLIFVGSLVPTIGFFNVYAFRFSYVADHWNYLPSLALAVAAAWGAVALAERWFPGRARDSVAAGQKDNRGGERNPRPTHGDIAAESPASAKPTAGKPSQPYLKASDEAGSSSQSYLKITAAAGLLLLAGLSVRQMPGYRNMEIFYQTILRKNPDCWLAAHNLGGLRLEAGRYAEAVPYYEQALRARPRFSEAINNLAGVLQRLGRRDEAIARFEEAVRLAPDEADYHRNLGAALASVGRLDAAVTQFRRAVELKPALPDLHRLLAQALLEAGQPAEAQAERAEADRLQNQR